LGESKQRNRAAQASKAFDAGVAHHRAGRLDAAETAYADVLQLVPAHPGALNMQGVLALQRGDATAALALFDRAISAGADGAGVFLNRGNALRALQRRSEALASYDRALGIDPRMAGAHVNRGNVLRDDGRLEEAAAAYHTALALDPTSFAAAANVSAVLAKLSARGDDAVLAAYGVAIALASRQGLRGPEVANCYNAVGVIHRRAGRVDEAIASLRSACDHDAKFAEAHFNLAQVFTDAARYGDALESLQLARELDPDLPGIFDSLALMLRRLGRNADAAVVYQQWSDKEPSNPIPAHMARALSGEPPPEAASAEYVRQEFDGFAAKFDEVLQTKLGYRAPALVDAAVHAALGEGAHGLDVADLGCGTGLCGPGLRPLAARLVGIDLSPKMLELAKGRGYDELVVDDIVSYCRSMPGEFDLLVAADVLVYIGDLVPLFAAARTSLRDGGHLVFTVERAEDTSGGYVLNVGGRFMHAEGYVRARLAGAGFSVLDASAETLRTELAQPVAGLVVVARAD
jgi:predicted TPR repeat methyltransferase